MNQLHDHPLGLLHKLFHLRRLGQILLDHQLALLQPQYLKG
jgi:hypothetical protein